MAPWFKPVSAGDLITNGLVSRWNFEDDSDTTTAIDSHGTNDGSINGATYTTTSQVGDSALSFDGPDDYVDVGSINELEGVGTISIVGWINFNSTQNDDNSDNMSIYSWGEDFDNYVQLGYQGDGGGSAPNSFWLNVENNSTGSQVYSSAYSTTGEWKHLGLVYDGSSELFVDGSSEGSTPGPTSTPSAPTHNLGNTSFFNWPLNGIADDIRVYDRALSASEISQIANGNG